MVLLVACASGQQADTGSAASETIAFTNVHAVPMDRERVLENHTVLVRDGLIADIGPSDAVTIPPDAREIDGRGGYLLPGLTDVHIHLRSADELVSYLAYGVTTVLHTSGAMSGAPDLLRYRRQLAGGELLGPRLYLSGPILDGDPPIFASVSTVATTTETARRVVAAQHEAGYDFIKVYNNLTPDVLAAVVRAAHEMDMAVIGHIPRKAGRERALQRALAAGQDMIAHGEEYFFTYFHRDVDSLLDLGLVPHPDEARVPHAVRLTKEAGAAVTPNLSFVAMTRRQLDDVQGVLSDPETGYLHPEVRAMWREQNPTRRPDLERFDRREQAKYAFLQVLTKALSAADVPLLLGTDAAAPGMFPGRSAHLELQELVAAGLTPYDALATGTRTAGEFIGKHTATGTPFGVIATGYSADLILVEGNPLDDIGNVSDIHGVMIRGRWLASTELQAMRDSIAATYSP